MDQTTPPPTLPFCLYPTHHLDPRSANIWPLPGRFSRVPFAHLDRHVELAMRVLGMFVEIAGTEKMATASFHVIRFHLPCWFSRSRSHQDNHTHNEKAYLLPASHIHLLVDGPASEGA